MLTKLTICNFKRFQFAEIELGNPVVFIGPNNSGKTTALQALALWDIGLKRWNEKRSGKKTPEKRPGVTINRRDLIAVPVPNANLLWHELHVRDARTDGGKHKTQNIRIDITVEGVSNGDAWQCGLEFDYANEESFYCRPLRASEGETLARMSVPEQASRVNVAFLPPMSGLASNETRLDPGAINVRLGEGRTAEVLRNLCYQIHNRSDGGPQWSRIRATIRDLFGVLLEDPQYIAERGEITMSYLDEETTLDLSSAGRGLQQTLLVLAHLMMNPNSIVLIDEPDAHLEILRQRQIYELLSQFAREQESQIIAASHSEIVLNEAADRDVVVAFLGRPHRIDDRGSQLLKSLKEIGFDQYMQAEQTGWVLYLEGSTDLSILRALATRLHHPAEVSLQRPFVHYVMNQPTKARSHFFGLREEKRDLVGMAVFDKLAGQSLQENPDLVEVMWSRREIENYICSAEVLTKWASDAALREGGGELFAPLWAGRMRETIDEIETAMRTLNKGAPWDSDTKVTDDFLDPLFKKFFENLRLPNLMQKTDYHVLANFLTPNMIDHEIVLTLDRIVEVASRAKPA
jgi:energy-coupling factor transporter ATP-binding protein EcfA2